MSKYVIDEQTLTDIADAVRSKNGSTAAIQVSDLDTAISDLSTAFPVRFYVAYGDYSSNPRVNALMDERFANYPDVYYVRGYLGTSKLTSLPTNSGIPMNCIFFDYSYKSNGADETKQFTYYYNNKPVAWTNDPVYIGQPSETTDVKFTFGPAFFMRYEGTDFTKAHYDSLVAQLANTNVEVLHCGCESMFHTCMTVKEYPQWVNELIRATPVNMTNKYMFYNARCLKKIENLAFPSTIAGTNYMTEAFTNTWSLRHLTFDSTSSIDLSARVSINLTQAVGCTMNNAFQQADPTKEINSNSKYEQLKDDPDAWTMYQVYCLYDLDSACETINSLPNVSSSGQACSISFKGANGNPNASGGNKQIGTMSNSWKAVATQKGWTVTIA